MPIETASVSKRPTNGESATSDDVLGDAVNPLDSEKPEAGIQVTDDKSLLQHIITKPVHYYIDRTGEPCLTLPGDGLDRAIPIQSRRMRAYVTNLAWNSGQILLSTAELERVLRALEGLAWEQDPCDASRDHIWNSLQEKPILQVVIEFMRERETHEAMMQILHKELSELATQLKFDLYSKQWPKIASHLSNQLRKENHIKILEQCGITVEIKRDRNGANVILKRVTPRIPGDDEDPPASPLASHTNSPPDDNLRSSDGGDNEKLLSKIDARRNEHKQNLNHQTTVKEIENG